MRFKEMNFQLLSIKVVMFCFHGASACLLPYMSIHMRKLGITAEETAIIYAILPFVQVIGSPAAGFIADRLGNYKPVLSIALIVSIITSFALMIIPSSGDPEKYQTEQQKLHHMIVFGVYLCVRILFQMANGVCSTLLDASAIFLCEKHDFSFGRIRFWGILATGLFSPICGLLVDYLSSGLDEFSTDYSPTFYFFNLFIFLTFIATKTLKIEVTTTSSKNLLLNIMPLLSSFTVWVFLVVIFVLGTMWGFVESFLFWYLLDLKAPKFLLGLTLTTGAIISLPFLHSSEWFEMKLGHFKLMLLALVFYFIRFVGYSFIYSPFWCFPFEAMEAFTYHLMWVAATTYSAKLAPKGLRATVIGVVGTLHNGIGRAAGSMVGGLLMWLFSIRYAFRYIGYIAGTTAIFYFISHQVFDQQRNAHHVVDENDCIKTHANTLAAAADQNDKPNDGEEKKPEKIFIKLDDDDQTKSTSQTEIMMISLSDVTVEQQQTTINKHHDEVGNNEISNMPPL